MNSEDRRFYVYLQRRKDNGVVFYVGKGTGDRYNRKKKSKAWLVIVKEAGGFFGEILKGDLTENEALALETELLLNQQRDWQLVNKVLKFRKSDITLSRIREYLTYDEDSPSCLIHNCWNNSKINKTARYKGDIAGFISNKSINPSYYMIRIYGKSFLVHRIIWMMFNGDIPDGFVINHKNNNSLDNRINNLEIVTQAVNSRRTLKTRKKGAGVYISIIKGRKYAIANWVDAYGKRNIKSFSFLKYGEEESIRLATEIRESKILELSHLGY